MRENPFWTAALWLFALLLLGILAAVELFRAWLVLLTVLLAMILAYHATNYIIEVLPIDADSPLVWGVVFSSLLIVPVVGVLLFRISNRSSGA